ncbi:MAG: AprI/Inh family metalloprotease inhibitor [Devosia sp.]
MARSILARLALALAAVLAGGAMALAQNASEPSSVPDYLQGLVGDWALAQEDETLPTCPLMLTDQQTTGGWAIEVPEPCTATYPSAEALTAWNIDETDGSVLLLDAQQHVTLRLLEDEDGLYDTDPTAPGPRLYLLAPYADNGEGGEADSD